MNSIEFQVQNSLPYILQTVVCVHTITNLSSSIYKINMLLLYYIMLFVLESFMFFFMSHDFVTITCVTSHHTFYLSSKLKKVKLK